MTTNPKRQRDAARNHASEGIQALLDADIAPAYVAEAYAAAGITLLLDHHRYEDARDLLTALFMQLDRHEERMRDGHTHP